MQKKLYVISNSHMDPVWLWRRASGRATWLNTAHSVVNMMAKIPELKFSCSSSAMYRWIEETDPALFASIKSLVKEGRWEIVGGWEVQSDALIASTESLIRQGLEGKRYFQDKFGVDVKTGYCVDSFGHSANLPKIFNATGLDKYVFLRPMSHQTKLPLLFDWRADDGSQVRALRIFDTYNLEGVNKKFYLDRIEQHIQYGLDKQTLFFGVGDHGGGIFKTHIQWLKEASENYDIHFATLQEYFDDVANDDIPLVTDTELGPIFPGCYTACHQVKEKADQAVRRLLTAERLGVPARELRKDWQEVLFNHFHDAFPGTCSWETYRYDVLPSLDGAFSHANECIDRELCRRAATLDTSFLEQGGIYLYNPQNKPVKAIVSFPGVVDPNETGKLFNAFRDKEGKAYDMQLMQGPCMFGPCGVPFGNLTAVIDLEACGEKVLAYESIDQTKTKNLGFKEQRELLPRISFQLFHDDTGTWGFTLSKLIHVDENAKLLNVMEFADGPVCSILRATYNLRNSEIQLDICKYAGINELKLALRTDWHEPMSMLKLAIEHGMGNCNFVVGSTAGRMQKLNGTVEWTAWQWNQGKLEQLWENSGETAMTEWCAAESNGKIAAFYAKDLHGCDMAGNALRMTILRATPYSDHHPFSRNEQTGFMDMGMNFYELWFCETSKASLKELPAMAQIRINNAECLEITGHQPSKKASSHNWQPQFAVPSKLVVEAVRLNEEGKWEFHIRNNGPKTSLTLPGGRKMTIGQGQLLLVTE